MKSRIVSRDANLSRFWVVPVRLIILAASVGALLAGGRPQLCSAEESRIQFILDSPSSRTTASEEFSAAPEEGTLVVQAEEISEDLAALYRRGKSLYRAGDYQQAVEVLQKVVEVDAEYERAAQYLAEARERLSLQAQKDEQLAAERQALQRQQDRETKMASLMAEGQEAEDAADYQKAIDAYRKVLQIDPENRTASRQLARAERDQAEAQKALAKEKQGQAAAQQEQKGLQEQAAQKAKIENLLGKADAASEAGNYEQAMGLYRQVLQLDEGNRIARKGMDRAERDLQKMNREKQELARQKALEEEKLKEEGARREAELSRQKAEEKQKQQEAQAQREAETARQKAAEEKKKQEEQEALARREEETARQRAAEEKKKQEEQEALARREEEIARQKAAEGQKQQEAAARREAELARQKAIEEQKLQQAQRQAEASELKDRIDALMTSANASFKVGDYDATIQTLNQLMELDPQNAKAEKLLGRAVEQKDKAEAAALAAEKEAEGKALAAEVAQYVERARVYLDADQLDQAEAELTTLLSKDPENSQAIALMDRLAKRRLEIEAEQAKLAEQAQLAEKARVAQEIAAMSKSAKDLYTANKIMEAHDVWTKILEIQPDNAEALAFMEQTKDAYQKAVDEKKKQEESAARQTEIETLLNQNVPLLDLKDTDIDNVLSLLGTISGFNIVATEGVEGIITVNIRNKTVREALDMILIPNGFKYTIAGKDITVTTNFITKIFPLDEAAYNKVSKILEDPTSLEDPTKELRRLIYGESGVSPIPGKELRLNPNTRSLIVSDTEDNLAKVGAFLQNIPDFVEAKEPLVSRHFKLDPDWAKQVFRLIELQLYGEIGKRSLAADDPRLLVLEPDTNIMIVKDTVNRIKDVEAILNNQALLEQLKREELIAKEFKISLEPEPPEGVSRTEWLYRREQEVSFVIDVLTQMLYGFEGQEEAIAKGRRIFKRGDYNLEQDGTITVVDTPENIKKVEDFLSQAQGRGQIIVEPLQVKHADINALRTLLDRVTGRRRDTDTEGGSVDDDRQDRLQITFTPDPNSQTIIVRSRSQLRDAVESIKDLILKLDVPIPQVEIESRLVEIKMEDNKALNFDWDFYELFEDSDNPLRIPGGINRTSGLGMISDQAQGMALSLATFGNSRFNFAMNWIEQLSNAEVLSAPKVTVTSDSEATINIVTNEPYISGVEINTQGTDTSADDQQIITYDITPVGITLTVTPTVLGDQSVVMNVNTAITAITGRLPIQIPATEGGGTSVAGLEQLGQPIISERSATTRVRVKDGDTLVIGGLIRDELTKTIDKVPLIGDIPYLGRFFRDTSDNNIKSQLLVFMTVRILPSE